MRDCLRRVELRVQQPRYTGTTDGVVICCGARDQQILNNTIYKNLRYGIEAQSGDGHVVINNILRSNGERDAMFHVSVAESNTVTDDPRFMDASAADFRLRSGSPAIDAGTPLQEVATDFANVPRPQGRRS